MYALVDCTNYRAIATHESYGALGALAYIQYANVDTVVHSLGENRHWAQFTTEELRHIFDSVVDGAAVAGVAFKTATYSDAIGSVRALIEAAPHLRLPDRIAATLEDQAKSIKDDDARPYTINTSGGRTPNKAKQWQCAPQRDRPRNAKPAAPQLTRAYGVAPAPSPKEAPAPAAAASRAAPPPPPKVAPPPPKVRKVLTAKAPKGLTYADFIREGWNDQLLIQHGYMKLC